MTVWCSKYLGDLCLQGLILLLGEHTQSGYRRLSFFQCTLCTVTATDHKVFARVRGQKGGGGKDSFQANKTNCFIVNNNEITSMNSTCNHEKKFK